MAYRLEMPRLWIATCCASVPSWAYIGSPSFELSSCIGFSLRLFRVGIGIHGLGTGASRGSQEMVWLQSSLSSFGGHYGLLDFEKFLGILVLLCQIRLEKLERVHIFQMKSAWKFGELFAKEN